MNNVQELTNRQILADQLGKAVLGAVAGFAAGQLSSKVYDMGAAAFRARKASKAEA